MLSVVFQDQQTVQVVMCHFPLVCVCVCVKQALHFTPDDYDELLLKG